MSESVWGILASTATLKKRKKKKTTVSRISELTIMNAPNMVDG
jgi:hypothetical protein